MSWTRGASNNITDTEISYKITSEADSTYIISDLVAHSATQQRTTITGLNPSTGYTVRARSYSYFNNTYSAYASATVTTGGTVVAEDDIANDQLALALSGTSLSLTNGGGSAQTFSNSSVGLGNVTNHAQIKDDGSNAPNILKNDEISISQGNSGVLTLTHFTGSTDTTTITKTNLGLSYTDGATNNGTTINSSGNITGNMSVGATLTLGTSANNKIVCGNVTIDGETGRILIED